jgi:GNAT superfamily N-acetyltransferase
MNITVREACLSDIKPLVALGKIMHEETAFAGIEWNPVKVRDFGVVAVSSNSFCVYVAEDNGIPVGMVIAEVVPYFFSDELRVCDHLWYVAKEYRGGPAAAKLIDKLIEFAKSKGVSEIYSGVSTSLDAEKTGVLLENIGYEHLGGLYKYKVQD